MRPPRRSSFLAFVFFSSCSSSSWFPCLSLFLFIFLPVTSSVLDGLVWNLILEFLHLALALSHSVAEEERTKMDNRENERNEKGKAKKRAIPQVRRLERDLFECCCVLIWPVGILRAGPAVRVGH